MDNNFEKEFLNQVKTNTVPTSPTSPTSPQSVSPPITFNPNTPHPSSSRTYSKPLIIVIAVLSLVVVIESIAVIILATNYGALASKTEDDSLENDSTEIIVEPSGSQSVYRYDNQNNLQAFSLSCTLDSGAKYNFTTSGTYEQYGANSALISSGNYTVLNNSIVSLSDSTSSDHTIYFDGFSVADGTTVYQCEEVIDDAPSDQ